MPVVVKCICFVDVVNPGGKRWFSQHGFDVVNTNIGHKLMLRTNIKIFRIICLCIHSSPADLTDIRAGLKRNYWQYTRKDVLLLLACCLVLFKKKENILTWTLVTRLDTGHLLGLLLLLDHDHASTVHHSTGLGDIILTGGHHAGGDDKCKCWGHGNGENYEEYCYGSPAAGAVAEIFGECWQTGVRWVTRSRLLDCVAQGVEVALKSPRQLLQLSRASEMFQLFLCCWLSPIWPMII